MTNTTEHNQHTTKIKTRANSKKELSLISEYNLISDTKDYLDEHFSGCYSGCLAEKSSRYVTISAEGYAKFLKVIFKAVFATHLIQIDSRAGSDAFTLNIAFSTSVLTEQDLESLHRLSVESGFSFKLCDDKIAVKFKYAKAPFSDFRAVSQRFLYKILEKILVL